jgi:Zn-dependent M28 family amino/carboxypeptidase
VNLCDVIRCSDAWVFGASDPNSGSSVLLEIARAFGELKKQGFVPDRTIRLCSWDAEEYGLVGSTAYAMANKQEVRTGKENDDFADDYSSSIIALRI